MPVRRERRESRTSLAAIGAVALVAALLGGAAVSYLPLLIGGKPMSQPDGADPRIAALEQKLVALASTPAAPIQPDAKLLQQMGALDARVAALESDAKDTSQNDAIVALNVAIAESKARLDALETKLATQLSAPAPAPAPTPGADPQELAQAQSDLTTLTADIAAMGQRLAALEQSTPRPEVITALDRRIAEMEDLNPAGAARAAAASLALTRLSQAVASGRSYVSELGALRAAAPSLDVSALESSAATGVTPVERLARQLEQIDPAIRSGIDEDKGGDSFDRFLRGLTSLVNVRETGEPQGNEPVDRLNRARLRMEEGDLAAASGELDWLWGSARSAAAGWIAIAKTRLAVDAALAQLSASLLQQMAAP